MTEQAIRIETATGRRIVGRSYLAAAQSAYCLMTEAERTKFTAWLSELQGAVRTVDATADDKDDPANHKDIKSFEALRADIIEQLKKD